MGVFNWMSDMFGDSSSGAGSGIGDHEINPASGLPMTDGIGSVDVGGNPYGMDITHDDHIGGISGCGFDD